MEQTKIAGLFLDPTVISGLTAITDGASNADYLFVWDAGTSTLKKILPDNLGLAAAAHTIESHTATSATGANLETLTNAGDADALHTHALKASLAAPALTGHATATTQAGTDDSTRIATTAHVKDVKIDDFAAGDDNTDLDSSTSRHGLLLKLGGGTTNFLRADGAWAAAGGQSFTGDTTVTSGNFVVATAGKGIDFSAQTASSVSTVTVGDEVLDHYEEGTWTPVAKSSGGVALSQQSNGDEGKYTRIGNVVYIQCRIIINGFNSANTGHTLHIYGLPFTHINGLGTLQTHFTCGSYALAITAGESIHAQIEENQDYVSILVWDETQGLSNLTLAEFSSDGQVGFTGHYFVS